MKKGYVINAKTLLNTSMHNSPFKLTGMANAKPRWMEREVAYSAFRDTIDKINEGKQTEGIRRKILRQWAESIC